jgi:hypothetical protein
MRERNIAQRKRKARQKRKIQATLNYRKAEVDRANIIRELKKLPIKQLRAIKAAADQHFSKAS